MKLAWVLAANPLRVSEIVYVDDMVSSRTQTIKLNSRSNISTLSVRSIAKFAENMHSMMMYVRALKERYIICSFDGHLVDVIDDTMTSDVLPASYKSSYIHYIENGRTESEEQGVFSMFTELKQKHIRGNCLV